MPISGPRTRAITESSECSLPLRSSNGLSRENINPPFDAAPPKLKPATENTPATSDCWL